MYVFKSFSTFFTSVTFSPRSFFMSKSCFFRIQPVSFEFLNLCSKIPCVPRYSSASLVVFEEQPIMFEMFLDDGNASSILILFSMINFLIEFIAISRLEVNLRMLLIVFFLSRIIVPIHCFDST